MNVYWSSICLYTLNQTIRITCIYLFENSLIYYLSDYKYYVGINKNLQDLNTLDFQTCDFHNFDKKCTVRCICILVTCLRMLSGCISLLVLWYWGIFHVKTNRVTENAWQVSSIQSV